MNRWVLRRKLHSSWLVAVMSIAFIAGVIVAQHVPSATFASYTWLIVALAVAGFCFWKQKVYVVGLIIIAGCLLGLWRGSAHGADLEAIHAQIGNIVSVRATVSDDADSDTSGKTILRMSSLSINDHAIGGTLWVSASTDADIKRSDRLTITGKVGPGFGSFAATMYEARVSDVTRPQPGDQARVIRDWFAAAVQTSIPQPQASLGLGFLVGQKRALPADLAEALVIAGLTHIVVASGYNLTILVRLARRVFMKVSKYTAALAAGFMIGGFVAVTGLSPSMSRAALVASLSLAAWYYGRKFHPLVLLSFAAAVTVMVNPAYMSGDLGWQLSFAAFAGVMILAPLLQRYFFGEKKPSFVRQILGETVAAFIVTAPILIGAFGQFSNVAIIANLLVLPLVPLAMLLTFIAGIGALIVPSFATVISLPATWLLGYMVYVAQWLSHLSWAQTAVQFSVWAVIGCYVLIAGACVYMWRVTSYDLREANIVE